MQYLAFFETKNVKSNRVSIGNENNNNFHRDYSFNVPGSQQSRKNACEENRDVISVKRTQIPLLPISTCLEKTKTFSTKSR